MKTRSGILAGAILCTALCTALAVPSFAGSWRQDDTGWWWQRDDGSYPAAAWEWIDSDGDGTAECYYFYSDGYMAHNNDIDGSYVNDDGKWTVAGKVQKKQVAGSQASAGAGQGAQAGQTGQASAAAAGRDFSYAQFFRGRNILWVGNDFNPAKGYYDPDLYIKPAAITDLGDCWRLDGVTINMPYEYSTKSQAEAKLKELERTESDVYMGDGWISQNVNGKYSIGGIDGIIYSYPAWQGSVYIRKDAVVNYNDYSGSSVNYDRSEAFATYWPREANRLMAERGEYFRGLNLVVTAVDGNGYVTTLRLVQWG